MLKAISLWEPWASLMAHGLKKNETRSWHTYHRGELAICAAKQPLDIYSLALYKKHREQLGDLQYGKIVCVVNLSGCLATDLIRVEGLENELGNYENGRFAWVTKDLKRLKTPVPVTGRQGLFWLPVETEKLVRKQL